MVIFTEVTAADQVWIALALLSRENPEREGFSKSEVVARVRQEFGFGKMPSTISTHISAHCVAIKKPDPGSHRMITKMGNHLLRLFRPEDPYHPDREHGKTKPRAEDIPPRFRSLLQWYESSYAREANSPKVFGPTAKLLSIVGLGSDKHDVSEHHDKYLAEAYYKEHHRGPHPRTS